MKMNEEKDNKINELKNELMEKINEIDNKKKDIDKNNINLVYSADFEGSYRILGKRFCQVNRDNFEIYINGIKVDLYTVEPILVS